MSCLIWVAASDPNDLRALMIPCTIYHSLLEYKTLSGHYLKNYVECYLYCKYALLETANMYATFHLFANMIFNFANRHISTMSRSKIFIDVINGRFLEKKRIKGGAKNEIPR